MKKLASLVLFLVFLAFAVGGCGPSTSPTAVPTEPLPTTVPPTSTSLPPTPTALLPTTTPLPPTAMPTDTLVPATPTAVPPLVITSSAFAPGAEIPAQYSCFGQNMSPPLAWSGVPQGTQSLALLVDDPDSSPPGFVHWVVYNIPPTASGLPENVPGATVLDDGTLQGSNDFARFGGGTFPGGATIKQIGYDGPCPGNRHRYVFTLYALDTLLDLPPGATMAQVLEAMQGHVLAQAELIGVYTPPQ